LKSEETNGDYLRLDELVSTVLDLTLQIVMELKVKVFFMAKQAGRTVISRYHLEQNYTIYQTIKVKMNYTKKKISFL
jgi:hypothetical protein